MAQVNDVAAYVLAKGGRMSAMKLQKLVYYSQAWHLVWEDTLLFDSPIEAWANGPVCPELYRQHRGSYQLTSWDGGDPSRLEANEAETIDAVLETYGRMSAEALSRLTHSEQPWIAAREGLGPGERGSRPIPLADMADYYGGLYQSDEAILVNQAADSNLLG